MEREEYVEAVLAMVEQIPPGRVTTYGVLAETVGVGGPRQVGAVMASYGGPVPWWRVVHADGRPATCHENRAMEVHRDEGTPLSRSGRIDMRAAMWWPPGPADSVGAR